MRLILALAKISIPFQSLIMKGVPFEKIKEIVVSLATMVMPIKRLAMILYLMSTKNSIGGLLTQDVDGKEWPMYYLSQ